MIDMDSAKILAEAAATSAAKEVAQEIREDMKGELQQMESRLMSRMDGYFGSASPKDHVIQHDRIERLLALMDRMGENIFTNILKQIIWGLIVVAVIGYLIWHKMTGGAG